MHEPSDGVRLRGASGVTGLRHCSRANVRLKRHGEDAPVEAAMRADAVPEGGDLDGYGVRKRVLKAVDPCSKTTSITVGSI